MSEFRKHLELVLADRHSLEAAALFETLTKYIHHRVRHVAGRYPDLFGPAEVEETVADVLFQMMSGGIHRFRGDSLPELIGFVRTVADRCTWRALRQRMRERSTRTDLGDGGLERIAADVRRADALEVRADSPLPEGDQEYLLELLRAGSKAELARRAGVSRAAVTQRVQRIRDRVGKLTPNEQHTHDAWLEQAAARVLME